MERPFGLALVQDTISVARKVSNSNEYHLSDKVNSEDDKNLWI
jgi:hypothetical protein